MKKTLIATAVFASFAGAHAQTAPAASAPTITPYARIDVGLSSTHTTGIDSKGLIGTDSAYNPSFWGVKGETDLGDGFKGFAQVEQSFAANGADALGGSGNARVGKVGVAGSFGVIELGAVFGPYDNSVIDAQDYNRFSAWGAVINSGAHIDTGNGARASGNTAGSINYTTPTVNGFNAAVNYAPAKDASNQDISSYGLDLTYNNGPVTFAAAYDSTPTIYSKASAPALSTGKTKAWIINGGYTLGNATLYAGLLGSNADGTTGGADKDSGFAFSVKYPVRNWTLSAGLGSVKTTGDDAAVVGRTDAFGVQAILALNKQFNYYVGARSTKTTPESSAIDSTTTNYFASGLSFAF